MATPPKPTSSQPKASKTKQPKPKKSPSQKTMSSQPKRSANSSEILLASRFFMRLELRIAGGNAIADATFLECQGFQRTQSCIPVTEVTPQQWGKASRGQVVITKVPGNVKTDNLVLRRGLTNSKSLWNWFKAVEVGKWHEHMAEGSLSIYDQAGIEQARYNFQRAWPMRYQAGNLNAQSSDIEIEELELAVESLVRSQ